MGTLWNYYGKAQELKGKSTQKINLKLKQHKENFYSYTSLKGNAICAPAPGVNPNSLFIGS